MSPFFDLLCDSPAGIKDTLVFRLGSDYMPLLFPVEIRNTLSIVQTRTVEAQRVNDGKEATAAKAHASQPHNCPKVHKWWGYLTLMARLFDSVAPEVKMISFESAPIRSATLCLATSTASSDSQP